MWFVPAIFFFLKKKEKKKVSRSWLSRSRDGLSPQLPCFPLQLSSHQPFQWLNILAILVYSIVMFATTEALVRHPQSIGTQWMGDIANWNHQIPEATPYLPLHWSHRSAARVDIGSIMNAIKEKAFSWNCVFLASSHKETVRYQHADSDARWMGHQVQRSRIPSW